jgi:hypothetical protein
VAPDCSASPARQTLIAFATAIAETDAFHRYTEPGIRLAAEPDSAIYAYAAVGSICRSYNILLDAVAAHDDLEALVLVHPHAEIVDADLCAKARHALRDADVGLVGAVGATNVRSIAWWDGDVSAGRVTHRYIEHGGGELPELAWSPRDAPFGPVDAVGGFLLVLPPWTVRNLRFDESLRHGQGFEVDFSLQVRRAGRKVISADLHAVHHHALKLVADLDVWIEAHMHVAQKWEGDLGERTPDEAAWKARARRAEAEREAARALTHGRALESDARVAQLERALAEVTDTRSWRATAPLRHLNALRTDAARRRNGRG